MSYNSRCCAGNLRYEKGVSYIQHTHTIEGMAHTRTQKIPYIWFTHAPPHKNYTVPFAVLSYEKRCLVQHIHAPHKEIQI